MKSPSQEMPVSSPAPESRPAESAGGVLSVRWLAESCGVASPGVSLPRLFTELLSAPEHAAAAQAYIAWWIHHADEGSSFDTVIRPISALPDEALIETLRRRNYDGLCYFAEGEIVGHVFFQNHGGEMCAFSASVAQKLRGGRLSALFVLDFVAYAARVPGIRRVSVGTGRNPVTRAVVALLGRHAEDLGWRVGEDGWIEFGACDNDERGTIEECGRSC
jgi:hypothetical protein